MDYTARYTGLGDRYVVISNQTSPGYFAEIVTRAEYETFPNAIKPSPNDSPDILVTGVGPAIGLEGSGYVPARLKPNELGLVVPPGLAADSAGEVSFVGGLDRDELRSAILLWDRIDWPEASLFPIPASAELDFLEAEGVLMRTKYTYHASVASRSGILDLGRRTFEQAETQEPGRWFLGQGESATETDGDQPSRTLLVKLNSVLAFPPGDIPLEDVLAFRERRKSELLAFRAHFLELDRSIREAPDRTLAIVTENDKLARAIDDQRRVASEAGWRKMFAGLTSSIKIEKAWPAGAAAVATLERTGSVTTALQAGAATLGITATAKFLKADRTKTPVDYIISIDREIVTRGIRTEESASR